MKKKELAYVRTDYERGYAEGTINRDKFWHDRVHTFEQVMIKEDMPIKCYVMFQEIFKK
jgi:hypothetical protein